MATAVRAAPVNSTSRRSLQPLRLPARVPVQQHSAARAAQRAVWAAAEPQQQGAAAALASSDSEVSFAGRRGMWCGTWRQQQALRQW